MNLQRSTMAPVLLYIAVVVIQGSFADKFQVSNPANDVETITQWNFHSLLYDYKSYGAITLLRLDIPQHTVAVNLTLKVQSDATSCRSRDVKIFGQMGGLPVVSRNGESFPDDIFVLQAPSLNVTVNSANQTSQWTLSGLGAGQLFLMAVMPVVNTRIEQEGLSEKCSYYISYFAIKHYIPLRKMASLPLDFKRELALGYGTYNMFTFSIPEDIVSFLVEIEGCSELCPVVVTLSDTLDVFILNSSKNICTWMNGTCRLQVNFPVVNSDYYLGLMSNESMVLNVTVSPIYCGYGSVKPLSSAAPSPLCEMQYQLGREKPLSAVEGSDMYDHFVYMDKYWLPHSILDLTVPDTKEQVIKFNLRTTDVGATLSVVLHLPAQTLPTAVRVWLCVSVERLNNASLCQYGAPLQLSSLDEPHSSRIVFPNPRSGAWYITLQSQCFHDNNSVVACEKHPGVNMTVHLSPCDNGVCGTYGDCKITYDSNIILSGCSCYHGWRGFSCNDGSDADSDFQILVGVYLLTLSNLFFLPGICLALYRRFFVEAMVYTFNMFFSTFYHACDTSPVFQLCIMPYRVLGFSDFFASLLSFWVTLMAMARIPPFARAFCHMAGVLFIAVACVQNRHGLVEQVVPITVGVGAVALTWGYEMYKKRGLFPSKRRLLLFILPGLLLACLGLVSNIGLETEENYKYMHSLWHLLVSGSIVFLLPPRRKHSSMSTAVVTPLGKRDKENELTKENRNRKVETFVSRKGVWSDPSSGDYINALISSWVTSLSMDRGR